VASIYAALDADGVYRVYDYIAGVLTGDTPTDLAQRMQAAGAGEILLNSPERDGSYRGFDIALICSVVDAVTVPVIAVGGAGRPSHFSEAFSQTGVSALAAGNIWHFWEHSVAVVKASIGPGIPIRRETAFAYADATTDQTGRLRKKPDEKLEQMLYVLIEPEEI
jgi:imidazole glycerol-phosphate synthase subunit HisF